MSISVCGCLRPDIHYTQPYVSSVSAVERERCEIEYDETTGVYSITANSDEFRILHLTDIHLGGGAVSANTDLKAFEACRKLIEFSKPDLVIVTGDLTYPVLVSSFSVNNYTPTMQFCEFMQNLGVPWAFTYGNHDTEAIATYSAAEIDALLRSLSYKTSGTLLYPYIQPDCFGRSNQLIMIKTPTAARTTRCFCWIQTRMTVLA